MKKEMTVAKDVGAENALQPLYELHEEAKRYGMGVVPPEEDSELELAHQADDAAVPVDQQLDRLELLMRQPDLSPEERLEKDQLFDLYADVWLGRLAERATVPEVADPHSGTMLAYDGKIRELSRPDDGALERMLVRHAALCSVHFQFVAMRYNALVITPQRLRIQDALFWERRMTAAQLRFLRAVKVLSRVRRLNRPSLQVNIGQKQVNIAGKG